MSCSGTYNFCFKKGFVLQLNWKDSSGAVVNLTGYKAKMTLRNLALSPVRFTADFTTATGQIVLGGSPHNVVVTALASETLAAPVATYAYDLELELINGTGPVISLLSGTATKEPSAVVP